MYYFCTSNCHLLVYALESFVGIVGRGVLFSMERTMVVNGSDPEQLCCEETALHIKEKPKLNVNKYVNTSCSQPVQANQHLSVAVCSSFLQSSVLPKCG
jgi:hypothetical protein